jgi:hypothetical protein
MSDIVAKILVELLSTLALATKQIERGEPSESVLSEALHYVTTQRTSERLVKLFREVDVEAVLERLDRLTQDEVLVTAPQTFEIVYGLIQNIQVVMNSEHIH